MMFLCTGTEVQLLQNSLDRFIRKLELECLFCNRRVYNEISVGKGDIHKL